MQEIEDLKKDVMNLKVLILEIIDGLGDTLTDKDMIASRLSTKYDQLFPNG